MRKLGITLGVIVAGIALLVAIYELGYTYRYRYRLAIEVDVDEQVKSGSSVIQVTRRLDPVTTTVLSSRVYRSVTQAWGLIRPFLERALIFPFHSSRRTTRCRVAAGR